LKDPGGGKEPRPSHHSIVEGLCLLGHEESRVPTDLSQFRISQTALDDTVNEAKCEGMLGHLQPIQVVQKEFRHSLDDYCVVAVVERLLGFQ